MNTGDKLFLEIALSRHLQNFVWFLFKSGNGNLPATVPRVTLVLELETRPGLVN